MGVVQSRHGSGTYIPDGPPTLGSEPLSFLAALHGFTREEMYEARRILEVGAAGLAAERASRRSARGAGRRSREPLRVDGGSAALPRARHHVPPHASPRRPAIRSSRRSSRWCRRSTTSGGAGRPSAPRIAICATPPRCTGASTRRFARATPRRRAWRCTSTSMQAAAHQSKEPAPEDVPGRAAASRRCRRCRIRRAWIAAHRRARSAN